MTSICLAVFVFGIMFISVWFFCEAMRNSSESSMILCLFFLLLTMIFGMTGSVLQSSGII